MNVSLYNNNDTINKMKGEYSPYTKLITPQGARGARSISVGKPNDTRHMYDNISNIHMYQTF